MEEKITSYDIERVLENGYDFRIGEIISTGWKLHSKNMWSTIAAGICFFFIIAFSGITIVGPYLLMYPLIAGLYIVADKTYKNDFVEFGSYFDGFKHFGQLFLLMILMFAFNMVASIPAVLAQDLFVGTNSLFMEPSLNPFDSFGSMLPMFGIMLLLAIPSIMLSILYSLAPIFVVNGKMEAWPAMEASRKLIWKKFWKVWGLMFLAGLISISGVLFLGIGVLFTAPVGFFVSYALYAKMVEGLGSHDDINIQEHLVG